MEASAGRGGPLPASSSTTSSSSSSQPQPLRKEWRAVSQDPEHVKLGHSDERTIYEEGGGTLGVDFCAITIDNGGSDLLQQRLQEISRQRAELHRMEVGLRVQAIIQSEILEVQRGCEARVKEHADAAAKLKEQLHEREQHTLELEIKLEEKDRELRALKIDKEAAWAKEDLLREQNKELATFRRERDNSEAERAQHLQKIHELQQHIQEKESQFLALEEQHRVAQEAILFKDEQLREAQTWISRVQEMDAVHSTTNQSLQAELRERTEQFNQYWIGFQRQFGEMERHHLQTIQQLQLELSEARERNGIFKDGSQVALDNSTDNSSYVQSTGTQINVSSGGAPNGHLGFISNGNLDNASSFSSASNTSTKPELASAVPIVPSSILGMGAFLPPGALHPFIMHPQSVPHVVPSNNAPNPHSHMGQFQPAPMTQVQHWPNDQAVQDVSKVPDQSKYQSSQAEQNLLRSNANSSYQHSNERQVLHPKHLSTSVNPHEKSVPTKDGSSEGVQVVESDGNQYQVSQKPHEIVNVNLQFNASLGYETINQKSEPKDESTVAVAAKSRSQEQVLVSGQQRSASNIASSVADSYPVSSNNVAESNDDTKTSSPKIPGKTTEPTLLDERSLLACIVRAIPAGSDGRIRISTTLPNRLGKMLAPLHWYDYKKYYGKLDDFVSRHLELFVIEGDFIHLREGAQEIISATAAYAKVAAAAASPAPYMSVLPSIAVTPVAQNNRSKKALSIDSKPAVVLPMEGAVMTNSVDSSDGRSHNPKLQNKQSNGVNTVQGVSDAKGPSGSKDLKGLNGFLSETRSNDPHVYVKIGNEAHLSRATLSPSQNKVLSNGRSNFGGKPQERSSGSGLISRRRS